MKKQFWLKNKATRTLGVLCAFILTLVTTIIVDAIFNSETTKFVMSAGLLGGFLGNITGAVGNLASGIITPIAQGVSTVAQGTTGLVSTIVNSPAGSIAAGSLSGLTGGSSVSGSLSGSSLAGKMGTSSTGGTGKKVSMWEKLFNFYKLGTPDLLVDTNGNEVLNYELDASGAKQYNWMKIIITGGIVVLLVWGIKKMFFKKKRRG